MNQHSPSPNIADSGKSNIPEVHSFIHSFTQQMFLSILCNYNVLGFHFRFLLLLNSHLAAGCCPFSCFISGMVTVSSPLCSKAPDSRLLQDIDSHRKVNLLEKMTSLCMTRNHSTLNSGHRFFFKDSLPCLSLAMSP